MSIFTSFFSGTSNVFAVDSIFTPPTSSTFNGILRTEPSSTGSRPKIALASFNVTSPLPYWSTARFVMSSLSSIRDLTFVKSTATYPSLNSFSKLRFRNLTILFTSGIIFSE